MQRFKLFRRVALALAFAEIRKEPLGVLLLAQTLLQFIQARTQRRDLRREMPLGRGIAQQVTRHVPGFITGNRAIDGANQLECLFKLAVCRLSDTHFLLQIKQAARGLFLFGLECFQPFLCGIRGQVRQMAQFTGTLKGGKRLLILDCAGLLNIQRLLIVRQLAFQFVHFQLSGFRPRFVLFLLFGGFSDNFILLFQPNLQLFQVCVVALDFFLLTQRRLHQIKMVAGRLIIGFQIAFRTRMFGQFARHIDMLILLGSQLLTAGKEIATVFNRFIEMNTALVGMTHIVCRHVVCGFRD